MGSYWIESTKNMEKNYNKLNENIETDICIIGAGITGSLVAYYLSKEGKNVVLLEKDKICEKTSGNTTAKITSQHGLFYNYLLQSDGLEFAKKYYEANENSIKNIENIVKNENIDCDFEKQDAYIFTQKEDEIKKIKAEFDAVKKIGGIAEFTAKCSLPFSVQGAIKFPNQAQFNSRKFVIELLNKIEKNGRLKIFENSKAIDVKKDKDMYKIYTKDNYVKAKYVILACHYPIINAPGFYFFKMYQSRSHAIAIEAETDFFEGMYINSELPTKSFRTIKYGDKRLLVIVGEDYKTGSNIDYENINNNLEKIAKDMYPNCKIKYRWSAQDCISLDKIPYIGEFSKFMPNVYIATGYKKWGMTTADIAGNIICDKIMGRKNEYEDIFKATRVEPIKNIKEVENMLKQTAKSLVIEKLTIPKEELEEIKEGEGKLININGKKVGVFVDENGKVHAVQPICSHLGCELSFNKLEHTWDCPCHGSRFDVDGKSLETPSIHDLEKVEIE